MFLSPAQRQEPDPNTSSIVSEPASSMSFGGRELIILAVAIFTTALIIRLACFTGLIASDDLGYVHYAQQISDGTYRLVAHHYAIRYGVIVPVSVLFRFYGVHEWTMLLLPLICSSLAAVFAAIAAAQLSGLSAAWVTGFLMSTFPVDVRYASVLVPEPLLQAILLAGALLFLLAERRHSIILGLAAGGLLGLSYLTKEPGAFIAVAFFVFALVRHQFRLAFSLLVGVTFVIAGEFVWYWAQSGDLLFRLHAMTLHNQSPMAVDANENLSYRIWKEYPRMMLVPNIDFGIHSIVALGLAAMALMRWRLSKEVLLLVLWAIVPFLYLNFGTSSFSHYWALPAGPRYIGLVYPPLFVLGGIALIRWAGNLPKQRRLVSMIVAVTCIVGIACAARTRGTGYRAEHAHRLKEIVVAARHNNFQICDFRGPDALYWRQVLQIVAPDRIGSLNTCPAGLQLLPDSNGLPVSKQWSRGTP